VLAGRDEQLARVLWIGGAQWAGKSSVAHELALRHGLVHYAYDYHDARSHAARARAEPQRFPRFAAVLARSADESWVTPSPGALAEDAQAVFVERFEMVLEDLRALPGRPCVVAEGWGLRPELVKPYIDSPRRAIFLVPSEGFRDHQLRVLPRAAALGASHALSDAARGQRNRLERDRLLADDAVESAGRLGLRVLVVDGSEGVAETCRQVAEHFGPHLPRWSYG
jgi:hypothetical protein